MAQRKLRYLDYMKAAFKARMPVKGLGKVPLNYLGLFSFGVLGVVNPGFLLIGLGAEMAYLFSLSQHKGFRNLVENDLLQDDNKDVEVRRQEMERMLCEEDRARLAYLRARCERIRDFSVRLGMDVEKYDAWSLASMQVIYTKLLLSRSVLGTQLEDMSVQDLNSQLEDAQQKLADASPDNVRLQQTLESTIDILKKRVANLVAARSKLSFIDAELVRIEQQVELIVEEAALAKEAGHLSSYIDSVVQTFGETRNWLSTNLDIAEQELERETQYVARDMQSVTSSVSAGR